MQNGMSRLERRQRTLAESSYFSQLLGNTEAISLAQLVRVVILLLTFAALAFVLFGRELKVIGLTVAIGWLLIVMTEAWRLPEGPSSERP
jgi:hypothetical protein